MKGMCVCLCNIGRAPRENGVVQSLSNNQGLQNYVYVESSGTASWHVGKPPDTRATAFAAARGVDLRDLRAQQVKALDFRSFDYILAMDRQNLKDLQALKPHDYTGELDLFLSFSPVGESEVPDPYYGGDEGFERVLDLVESASQGLLAHIKQRSS